MRWRYLHTRTSLREMETTPSPSKVHQDGARSGVGRRRVKRDVEGGGGGGGWEQETQSRGSMS